MRPGKAGLASGSRSTMAVESVLCRLPCSIELFEWLLALTMARSAASTRPYRIRLLYLAVASMWMTPSRRTWRWHCSARRGCGGAHRGVRKARRMSDEMKGGCACGKVRFTAQVDE